MTHKDDPSQTETLDTSGLLCAMTVIRTQDLIRTLNPGTVLKVTATDPGTTHDIPAWCRVHGHEVIDLKEQERSYQFTIRVNK